MGRKEDDMTKEKDRERERWRVNDEEELSEFRASEADVLRLARGPAAACGRRRIPIIPGGCHQVTKPITIELIIPAYLARPVI